MGGLWKQRKRKAKWGYKFMLVRKEGGKKEVGREGKRERNWGGREGRREELRKDGRKEGWEDWSKESGARNEEANLGWREFAAKKGQRKSISHSHIIALDDRSRRSEHKSSSSPSPPSSPPSSPSNSTSSIFAHRRDRRRRSHFVVGIVVVFLVVVGRSHWKSVIAGASSLALGSSRLSLSLSDLLHTKPDSLVLFFGFWQRRGFFDSHCRYSDAMIFSFLTVWSKFCVHYSDVVT